MFIGGVSHFIFVGGYCKIEFFMNELNLCLISSRWPSGTSNYITRGIELFVIGETQELSKILIF